MPEVRANGIRLYYEEHGAGTPILGGHLIDPADPAVLRFVERFS